VRRTKEMLDTIRSGDAQLADPKSLKKMQPAYATNEMRAIKDEYLVVVGICTHLGCSPVGKFAKQAEAFDPNWQGGFYCPCHGSLFDLAGRVYKNKPAPDNLVVPPHKYLSDTRIVIGEDTKGA
jgi:ubiquinol-cytochrome c reductase iron-sulfur subunit